MTFPILAQPESWEDLARCRSYDPALFFGPTGFEPKKDRLAREQAAKHVCASCPALVPCRERALRDQEPFGVWGGLTELERRAVLERRGAA